MKISLEGYRMSSLTLALEGAATMGTPVKISGNNTVKTAAAGEDFLGFVLSSRTGYALVQTQGAMVCSYSGTAPTLGQGILVADGAGGVKTAAQGTTVQVLAVDSGKKTVSILL